MPTMNRRAARRDTSEAPIIDALKRAGCSVQQLSDKGVPDLLVSYPYTNYQGFAGYETILMEVKTGKAKLTSDEETFIQGWKGAVYIVRAPQEALEIIGVPERDFHRYIVGYVK